MRCLSKLRQWARALKRHVMVLWFAARHPATPWPLRLLATVVVAYALSPIDLIPDFIPVLGYLDDVILVPLGLLLVLRLLPAEVLAASREQAEAWERRGTSRPVSRCAAYAVILIWLLVPGLIGWMLWARG